MVTTRRGNVQAFRREGAAYQEAIAWWKERFEHPPRLLDLPFKRSAPLVGFDPAEGIDELAGRFGGSCST